jgi:hypothetical protein
MTSVEAARRLVLWRNTKARRGQDSNEASGGLVRVRRRGTSDLGDEDPSGSHGGERTRFRVGKIRRVSEDAGALPSLQEVQPPRCPCGDVRRRAGNT